MKENNLDRRVTIRLTQAEYAELVSEAKGVKLSEFVRQKLFKLSDNQENVRQIAQKPKELSDKKPSAEPEKAGAPQESRGKSKGKPNQVCRALGHRLMMQEGKMTCERCGIQA